MPETAVDKDNFAMSWQNNIGLTGQIFPVETEPKPKPMENRPDSSLWFCVFTMDSRHQY